MSKKARKSFIRTIAKRWNSSAKKGWDFLPILFAIWMQRDSNNTVANSHKQDRKLEDTHFTSLSSIIKIRKQKVSAAGQKQHKLNKTISII